MLMPDLKDFFKNLNFVSECCNGGNVIVDAGDDDYQIFRRIERLEHDYDRCIKHQAEVRATIAKLVQNLEDSSSSSKRSSESSEQPLLSSE